MAERYDVIVIGAGQAGLATGYHLARRGARFVILEANERVGDSWRRRWDGLRVFTPARNDGLPGLSFPAPGHAFPTKDEIADYLEAYSSHMELPIRLGVHVDSLDRTDGASTSRPPGTNSRPPRSSSRPVRTPSRRSPTLRSS